MIENLTIIGVGLIGSSLALALKQVNAVGQVIGCDSNQQNLQKAMALGVIDRFESIAAATKLADIVVIAVPLGAMESVLVQIYTTLTDGIIVTDVGSSKASVVAVARRILGDRMPQFVPGHPIAGTEKSGVESGFATLYQNRQVILTPIAETDPHAVQRVTTMWQHCGASIESLELEYHDKVLAATSHLPHILAYTMVNYLSHLNNREAVFKYAAGGFRDFTRIASSDPVMWRDICLSNREALLALIAGYQDELNQVTTAICSGNTDQLLELFSKAKLERDALIGHC